MITPYDLTLSLSYPSSCIKHLLLVVILLDLPVPLHHLLPPLPKRIPTNFEFEPDRQNNQVPLLVPKFNFNKKVKVDAIRLISSKEMLIENAFQKCANFH